MVRLAPQQLESVGHWGGIPHTAQQKPQQKHEWGRTVRTQGPDTSLEKRPVSCRLSTSSPALPAFSNPSKYSMVEEQTSAGLTEPAQAGVGRTAQVRTMTCSAIGPQVSSGLALWGGLGCGASCPQIPVSRCLSGALLMVLKSKGPLCWWPSSSSFGQGQKGNFRAQGQVQNRVPAPQGRL